MMKFAGAGPLRGPRLGASVAVLAGAALVASCSQEPRGARSTAAVAPAITGLNISLDDEVRKLPRDRIAWSTYWTLCWAPYPGATSYELRPLTGEGNPSTLRRQRRRCFRIEAAAGENRRADGLRYREEQLALQRGQLAYQVRAVLDDEQVSAWTDPMAVGARR